MKLKKYSSLYTAGHRKTLDLFAGDVIVEEKVDGSQFSFGVIEGEIFFRSKGKQICSIKPDSMFKSGVEELTSIKGMLPEGVTFRGEYLGKPRHNVLKYDRTPKYHVIVFDVMAEDGVYLQRHMKESMCKDIGLEIVPLIFSGRVGSSEGLKEFLGRESVLGGSNIEGVVIKPLNNDVFDLDGDLIVGKYVCDKFKEKHTGNFKAKCSPNDSILISLGESLKTEARWQKAVQHLSDDGVLKGEPEDIRLILNEIGRDTKKEEEDYIKEELFKWAWPQLNKMITKGAPQWYKEKIASNF